MYMLKDNFLIVVHLYGPYAKILGTAREFIRFFDRCPFDSINLERFLKILQVGCNSFRILPCDKFTRGSSNQFSTHMFLKRFL